MDSDKLKSILDGYDKAREVDKERVEKLAVDVQQFQKAYQDAVQNTIRPAIQPILDQLKARGHGVEVKAELDGTITVSIAPKDTRRASSLMFQPSFHSKSVKLIGLNVAVRFGSTGGPRGEIALSALTKQVVEAEVMKVVGEVFGL
jgi:EAL domain-containing protein (putative c-di-GMP-specific phosphodiesterase class I)